MRVTFPHMGTVYLSITTLLADLGLEPVAPPATNRRTVELGVKHAPEFACFPLKINLGNYLEAFEAGAEAILMVGGVGPCRLGYYAEVEREILREAGYDFEMVVLEPPKRSWGELWTAARRLVPRPYWSRIVPAVIFAYRKIAAVDEIERLVNRVRPRELRRGETTRAWRKCREILAPVTEYAGLRKAVARCREYLAEVALVPDRVVPRVRLVGEIYMLLEPAVNFEIERTLGESGVAVMRRSYLSSWIERQIFKDLYTRSWLAPAKAMARPYLGNHVGGHGLESVAEAVDAAINRLDGVIHLAPFTCMPEIVAQSVLPAVGRELDLPVMSLILDEHSAEAGVVTRLEAFLDLLKRRRNHRDIAPQESGSPLTIYPSPVRKGT